MRSSSVGPISGEPRMRSRNPGAKRSTCASMRSVMSSAEPFGTWQYAQPVCRPAGARVASNRLGCATRTNGLPRAAAPRPTRTPRSRRASRRRAPSRRARTRSRSRDRPVERPVDLERPGPWRNRAAAAGSRPEAVRRRSAPAPAAKRLRGRRRPGVARRQGWRRGARPRDPRASRRALPPAPASRRARRATRPRGRASAARARSLRRAAFERQHRVGGVARNELRVRSSAKQLSASGRAADSEERSAWKRPRAPSPAWTSSSARGETGNGPSSTRSISRHESTNGPTSRRYASPSRPSPAAVVSRSRSSSSAEPSSNG